MSTLHASNWPGLAATALVALSWQAAALAQPMPVCKATSGPKVAPVVELYTSEGCNSCPPADRWLSALKADPGVVAMAFHVDYWDRLGWKDRFASQAYTQRQAQQRQSNGARFSYTPQVVVDGADRQDWRARPAPASTRDRAPARLTLDMSREGGRITATVKALPGAPAQLAAYWAVTEHDHVTAVKAGENDGVTLVHDYVVREVQPVAAWSAPPDSPVTLSFDPSTPTAAGHPRHVNLVVLDATNGRPLQALRLGC
ncbi:MAG: DUF1223 domain-containing protein [Rhizobacter sp.]|nr:DUF1223 domain-containing protein [Rhizobacter sp.]